MTISRRIGRHSLYLLAAGLVIAPALAAAKPKPVIPEAFRGEWYTEPQTCGYDIMAAFIIEETGTTSGETDGLVVAVRVISPTHIVVTIDEMGEKTADTPPGTDPSKGRLKSDYRLSENDSRLKVRFGRRHTIDYIRCTPPKQPAS